MIRSARADDVPALRELERAANRQFEDIGMAEVAAYEPTTAARLEELIEAGQVWVATDPADHVLAGVLMSVEDGAAHVDQISVDPAHGRRRLGRALLDRAQEWARETGLPALTLTTFADVPWNAPYYRRLGFAVLGEDELTEDQRRRAAENAAGPLGRWARVTMRRPVSPSSP